MGASNDSVLASVRAFAGASASASALVSLSASALASACPVITSASSLTAFFPGETSVIIRFIVSFFILSSKVEKRKIPVPSFSTYSLSAVAQSPVQPAPGAAAAASSSVKRQRADGTTDAVAAVEAAFTAAVVAAVNILPVMQVAAALSSFSDPTFGEFAEADLRSAPARFANAVVVVAAVVAAFAAFLAFALLSTPSSGDVLTFVFWFLDRRISCVCLVSITSE